MSEIQGKGGFPWELVLPARTSAPVISFCNDVFIVVCSKPEEFHHRVVTILHLPGGQRLNIENTSDLDKLRADETKRVLSAGANLYMGTLDVSLRSSQGKLKNPSDLRGVDHTRH